MKSNGLTLVLKIFKIVISVVLVIATTVSMLGATLITVAREYLESEQFTQQVESTDLSSVMLKVGNSKITVLDYARSTASKYLENQISGFSYFGNYGSYAVNSVVTPELINATVKKEAYELIEYFLHSDVEKAKYRIENNVTVEENDELNLQNATDVETAISTYIRTMVLKTVENYLDMSTDNIIVLISQETATKLIILSVVLIILLVIINLRTIFNNLLYGGAMGIIYGTVIKLLQNKFTEINEGLEDLVGYVFLKPLADTYSKNAIIGLVTGAVLIVLFVAVYFLFKKFVNKKDVAEEKR